MEYTVISESSIERLIKSINNAMQEGWIPQGGICEGNPGFNGRLFYQAMIKNR